MLLDGRTKRTGTTRCEKVVARYEYGRCQWSLDLLRNLKIGSIQERPLIIVSHICDRCANMANAFD